MLIGIRKEDKNIWEKRVPLTPSDIQGLIRKEKIEFQVESSARRVFSDADYAAAGAKVVKSAAACPIVFAVKEMPVSFFRSNGVYIFFSHTIKGQKAGMPMLKKLLDLPCTLIDYEKITDGDGRRLIAFGRHAGIAGMMDSLWAYGRRLDSEGVSNPFRQLKPAHAYPSLGAIREAVIQAGRQMRTTLVCGFTGYGRVSQGAQEIFDLLPASQAKKIVFKESDLFERADGAPFDLRDYYQTPQNYRSVFEKYLPGLDLLINAIYWEKKYPRLVTKAGLKKAPRLKVIGDISCDVEGSIEVTVKATDPGNPVYVYDLEKDRALDGFKGSGPVILAVDNLPCEVAREASTDFSAALKPLVPAIAKADYALPFEKLSLPAELKKAVICHGGRLTPGFEYLKGAL
ncbi:MAG: hypothetical protein HY609_04745 [Deltaproteobacteria bacterium]|nr:hypothetical protein [Deltaproteobacteria bacterium]